MRIMNPIARLISNAIVMTALLVLLASSGQAAAPATPTPIAASQSDSALLKRRLSEATRDYDGVRLRQLAEQMESNPGYRQTPEALLILGQAYEHLAELSLLEDRRTTDRLAESAVKYLKSSLGQAETSAGYSALAHTYQVMTFAKKLNGPLLGPKMSQSIKRALELDPANFQALLLEAQGFLDPPPLFGGDVPKAIDILIGLTQQFPDSDQVFYQLGRAYAKAKDNARARKALDSALKLNPRNPFARRLLSTLGS